MNTVGDFLIALGAASLMIGLVAVIFSGPASVQSRLNADVAQFIVERECVRDHYSPDHGVIYRCLGGVWSVRDIERHYEAQYKAGK